MSGKQNSIVAKLSLGFHHWLVVLTIHDLFCSTFIVLTQIATVRKLSFQLIAKRP